MKFGVVNKSTTVDRFVLHTLQRNITHLALITRKTNIKLGLLKGGNWKRAVSCYDLSFLNNVLKFPLNERHYIKTNRRKFTLSLCASAARAKIL